MIKSMTIHIDTDGRSTFEIRNSDIDTYNDIIRHLEKKKNIKFSDTYIMWQHVTKVWFEVKDEE